MKIINYKIKCESIDQSFSIGKKEIYPLTFDSNLLSFLSDKMIY